MGSFQIEQFFSQQIRNEEPHSETAAVLAYFGVVVEVLAEELIEFNLFIFRHPDTAIRNTEGNDLLLLINDHADFYLDVALSGEFAGVGEKIYQNLFDALSVRIHGQVDGFCGKLHKKFEFLLFDLDFEQVDHLVDQILDFKGGNV